MTKAEQEWSLIEALEYCKGKRLLNKCCAGCPYAGVGCAIDVAISKLKAQEPVKPVVDMCGNCGHTLEYQQLLGDNVLFHEQYNYCPECGRAVKWE